MNAFVSAGSVVSLTYANFIGHTAVGRAAPGQLLRHDEAGHRAAAQRRSALLYRGLPSDDLPVRPGGTPPKYDGGGPGFPFPPARPDQGDFLSTHAPAAA